MADDILKHAKRLQQFWIDRTRVMEQDRRLRDLDETFALVKDVKIGGKVVKIIDNQPQTYWDWAVASLATNPFRFVVPMQLLKNEAKANKLERLLYGIEDQINELLARRLQESFRFMLAEQIVGGWYAYRPDIIPDGTAWQFIADFYDPMTVYQQFDARGLSHVARVCQITLAEARSHVAANGGDPDAASWRGDDTQYVEIVEYWRRTDMNEVLNAYLIAGVVALPLERQDYPSIPIITGAVNGRSGESSTTMLRPIENWGRSIFAPNRRIYQQANTWATLHRERARQVMFPHMKDKTVDAKGVVEPQDIEAGEQVIWHLDTTEDVEAVQMPGTPVDVAMETARDQLALQRGSIPDALYGQNSPGFASGYLEKSLEHKATLRLSRYAASFTAAAERGFMQLIRQARALRIQVRLKGIDRSRNGISGYFEEQFDAAADIPDYFPIQIRHELSTPVDRAQIANTEAQLVQSRVHSVRRAMEATGVEDSIREHAQIIDEQASLMTLQGAAVIALKLEKLAKTYDDAGDKEMAAAIRTQAEMTRQQAVATALQQSQGAQQPQTNAPLTGLGLPSAVLPNEATGRGQLQELMKGPPPGGAAMARFGNQNGVRG